MHLKHLTDKTSHLLNNSSPGGLLLRTNPTADGINLHLALTLNKHLLLLLSLTTSSPGAHLRLAHPRRRCTVVTALLLERSFKGRSTRREVILLLSVREEDGEIRTATKDEETGR